MWKGCLADVYYIRRTRRKRKNNRFKKNHRNINLIHYRQSLIDDICYNNNLIKQYKNKFPEEYLYLLEHINGADFHWLRVDMENGDGFAYSLLTIFGLPITPPFARDKDMEEPFDVRIEDLNRTFRTPDSWLKFGQYVYDLLTDEIRDLYID